MDRELSGEGESYDHVISILRSQFGSKKDHSLITVYVLNLKLGFNQTLVNFLEVTEKEYDAIRVTDEHNFAFLSKATLDYEDKQDFVAQRAPTTFQELWEALLQYHLSCFKIRKINENGLYASK